MAVSDLSCVSIVVLSVYGGPSEDGMLTTNSLGSGQAIRITRNTGRQPKRYQNSLRSNMRTNTPYMGGCQNYGPFLGTLHIRCRIIIGAQKGTVILTTTSMILKGGPSYPFDNPSLCLEHPQTLSPKPGTLNLRLRAIVPLK